MESMEIPWNPFKFYETHGNLMESVEILWNPWKFNGIHGNSMESMEIPIWKPRDRMCCTSPGGVVLLDAIHHCLHAPVAYEHEGAQIQPET